MDPLNFVYWLQGIFEIGGATELNSQQVEIIKRHIALVLHHVELPPAGTMRLGCPGEVIEPPPGDEQPPSVPFPARLQEIGARPPWRARVYPHPFDPTARIC